MVAHIISIDTTGKATKLMLAGSQDDIEAKKSDIDLTMTATIPRKDMPKEDTDFQFQGTPVSYTPKPFLMTMDDGALLVKAKPKHQQPRHRKGRGKYAEPEQDTKAASPRGPPFFCTPWLLPNSLTNLFSIENRRDARCVVDAWLLRASGRTSILSSLHGAAKRIAVHAQFASCLALVAAILFEHGDNETLFEFPNRFRVENVAFVHLQNECFQLIFH